MMVVKINGEMILAKAVFIFMISLTAGINTSNVTLDGGGFASDISLNGSDTTEIKGQPPFIIAILDLDTCEQPLKQRTENPKKLLSNQRLENLKWTIQKLCNDKCEFNVISTCQGFDNVKSEIISYSSYYGLIRKPKSEGVLGNPQSPKRNGGFLFLSSLEADIRPNLQNLLQNIPIFTPFKDDNIQLGAISLMQRLGWREVVMVATDQDLMENFGHLVAKKANICVVNYIVWNTENSTLDLKEEISRSGVKKVLLMVDFKKSVENVILQPSAAFKELTWIVVTQGMMTTWKVANSEKQSTSLIGYSIEKDYYESPEFVSDYQKTTNESDTWEDPMSFEIMKTIYKMVFNQKSLDDFTIREKLGLSFQPPKFIVNALVGNSNGEIVSNTIGYYSPKDGLQLSETNSVVTSISWNDKFCHLCTCKNLPKVTSAGRSRLRWKEETWVTVMITVATMGAITTLCIGAYISYKSFSEVLEGSQITSVCFLVIILMMFSSLVMFGFHASEMICKLRFALIRLVYVMAFSLMCSRSIMLATSDLDGLPGHISGYTQAILYTFMVGVQIALVTEEWIQRSNSSYLSENANFLSTQCSDSGYPFLLNFSYVVLLILLQLILTPFIVRSERNYREGLLFLLAALSCLMVWIGWSLCYILFLDQGLGDIFICCGLISTASVLIITVFIPKCYLLSASRRYTSHYTRDCDTSAQFWGPSRDDFSGAFSTATSNLSHLETLRLQTATTNEDGFSPNKQNNSTSCLGTDLCDTFKERLWKPSRPNLHLVDAFSITDPGAESFPTYKLDRNTVVDTSMRWERYGYPMQKRMASGEPSPLSPQVPILETNPFHMDPGTRL